jgi:mRNA-degrading endonuclease RelE of RelBE toxin-antitoxin system
MKLEYRPNAIKQLNKLPEREKRKIVKKLNLLVNDPLSGKLLQGEYLGYRSLRAWPYRIIYRLTTTSVLILSIAHRQSAY